MVRLRMKSFGRRHRPFFRICAMDSRTPRDGRAIEELGHAQPQLAELLGSRSRASEILSRRRALTVEMIHKISEAWKIPADLLVRPYKIERAA